jgi:hypothetical protein
MMQPRTPSGGAAPELDAPTIPLSTAAKQVTCHICGTTFDARGTDGKCPVCGEQAAVTGLAAREIPVISPVWRWVRQGGNWRLAALALLILYQIILFVVLWAHMAQLHAL